TWAGPRSRSTGWASSAPTRSSTSSTASARASCSCRRARCGSGSPRSRRSWRTRPARSSRCWTRPPPRPATAPRCSPGWTERSRLRDRPPHDEVVAYRGRDRAAERGVGLEAERVEDRAEEAPGSGGEHDVDDLAVVETGRPQRGDVVGGDVGTAAPHLLGEGDDREVGRVHAVALLAVEEPPQPGLPDHPLGEDLAVRERAVARPQPARGA